VGRGKRKIKFQKKKGRCEEWISPCWGEVENQQKVGGGDRKTEKVRLQILQHSQGGGGTQNGEGDDDVGGFNWSMMGLDKKKVAGKKAKRGKKNKKTFSQGCPAAAMELRRGESGGRRDCEAVWSVFRECLKNGGVQRIPRENFWSGQLTPRTRRTIGTGIKLRETVLSD